MQPDWLISQIGQFQKELVSVVNFLGSLSPSQIELELKLLMKESKQHDRMKALVDYLNEKTDNLQLQVRYENGNLIFGTFWLRGENRLVTIRCPEALHFYLDVPSPRTPNLSMDRRLQAAIVLISNELGLKPEEVMVKGVEMIVVRYKALIEALIGNPAARERNRDNLVQLEKQFVFGDEVLQILEQCKEKQDSPSSKPGIT